MASDSAALLAVLAKQGQVAPIPAPTFRMDDPFATLAGFGNSFSAQAAQNTNQLQNKLLMERVRALSGRESQSDNLEILRKLIANLGPEAGAVAAQQVLQGIGAAGGDAVEADLENTRREVELGNIENMGDAAKAALEGGFDAQGEVQDLGGTDFKSILPLSIRRAIAGANTTTTRTTTTPSGKPIGGQTTVKQSGVPTAEGASGLPGQTAPLKPQGRPRTFIINGKEFTVSRTGN